MLLPDSSWEYELAVDQLERARRGDGTLDNRGAIAYSPLVLVRPRQVRATSVPGTWRDVLATAGRDSAGRAPPIHRPSPVTSGAGVAATALDRVAAVLWGGGHG